MKDITDKPNLLVTTETMNQKIAEAVDREREACIDIYESYFDLPKQAILRACAREKVRERGSLCR